MTEHVEIAVAEAIEWSKGRFHPWGFYTAKDRDGNSDYHMAKHAWLAASTHETEDVALAKFDHWASGRFSKVDGKCLNLYGNTDWAMTQAAWIAAVEVREKSLAPAVNKGTDEMSGGPGL